MRRNKKFYEKYTIKQYFLDILTHAERNYINYLNDFEIFLLKEEFNKPLKKALVIGMGYGREIDWLKKIYLNIKIDIIDYSNPFVNFGKNNYKNVSFFKIDLNKIDNYDFSKYDLILCFNTFEYLKPSIGTKLILDICKKLKNNSIFVLRLQNKNFFMAPLIQRIISKRSSNLPITFFYDVCDVLKKIEKFSIKIVTIKGPLQLIGFKYIYTFLWNFFSYFELVIRLIVPKKYTRAIYIKLSK
jgi:hypothetical protein